jgi:hypothetical protein
MALLIDEEILVKRAAVHPVPNLALDTYANV